MTAGYQKKTPPPCDATPTQPSPLLTFLLLKPRITRLLLDALQIESDSYNVQLLLGGEIYVIWTHVVSLLEIACLFIHSFIYSSIHPYILPIHITILWYIYPSILQSTHSSHLFIQSLLLIPSSHPFIHSFIPSTHPSILPIHPIHLSHQSHVSIPSIPSIYPSIYLTFHLSIHPFYCTVQPSIHHIHSSFHRSINF